MKMEEIRNLIEEDKKIVSNLNELNDLKVKYLGKKGLITELNQEIKNVPNEEKKEFGQKVNELRTLFNDFYEEKKVYFEEEILNEKLKNESIDITLPSKRVKRGSKHPMTRITEQFEDLFVSMGYTVYEGPDAKQQPAGRVGNPLDIVNMIAFLAYDKAGFITGENICIDGGQTKLMIYHGDHGWTLE